MRITIQDVKTTLGITQTYDIVNAIANSSGDSFKNYVPLANANNVAEVGAGILINQTIQNEFITALVDRIGLVVVRGLSLQNPLKKFKKGMMPQGRTIEEVFTDITKSKKYDPSDAESTVYARVIPNVKTLFHERNRQDFYKQTIQDDSLTSAFVSWNAFENFVASIINAIYNSAEVEEYEYMKLIIDNYYSKGLFTVIPIAPVTDEASAKLFIKQVRATVTKMTLPNGSTNYNALAVRTRSDMTGLHLIIDADYNAIVDVDVLSAAFNMSKADFLGNVTVIDGFASTGLKAVLVDRDWFMVYDNLMKLETIRNPQGLYWNYFYHVWQTMSASRFANAVAFVLSANAPAVTQVIVSPAILAVKAGTTYEFTGIVRQTDANVHAISWDVASTSTVAKKAGTTIDANGILTIASDETEELRVTATTNGGVDLDGAGADTTDVVGEAIVSIIK